MSRSVITATRPQLALQSYLDALLQEAAAELADSDSLDEFETAVLEEQVRDARLLAPQEVEVEVLPVVVPQIAVPLLVPEVPVLVPVEVVAVEPPTAAFVLDEQPSWAEEPFECLLFDVAGLTLAVPLVCLGTIYPLQGQELTPLFGQPDWFLGILPSQSGNLKVLDTDRKSVV